MTKRRRKTAVLGVVSDPHAGGSTALCPPTVELDDGGSYQASKLQRWLFERFEEFWAKVDDKRTELGADLYVILNGDLIEGQHHNTTQVLSGNPNAQAAVVNAAMSVPLALNPQHILIARGTEAHVGASACAEERIADGLRRDKRPIIGDPQTGTASWWHARMDIHGVRIDIAHHGRSGFREHTRQNAANLYAHDILAMHVKAKERHPDLCLRGHHHKFNDSHDACPVRVFTTGCWQFSTAFGHRVATDSLPDIGGAIVVIEDGAYQLEKVQFQPERGPIWRPA